MAVRVGQAVFAKGEIAEELVARVDVSSYATALRRARNVTILKYGGVTKRPGSRLVAEVYQDSGVRLMPFQFSLSQTYALEMGQGYMRAAALGGLVVEDRLTVQSVVFVSLGIYRIGAAFHGYAVGDQVFFDGVSGATELNGKILRVFAVAGPNEFDVQIISASPFTGDTGGITRATPPAPAPTPPVVPPPAVEPPPPPVGGGGGGGDQRRLDDGSFP